MTRRFYRRTFLNRRGHHAGAYVIAALSTESYLSDGIPTWEVSGELTIADCSRVADLDFSVRDTASARNSLHKARLLTQIVTQFTAALEAAVSELGLDGASDPDRVDGVTHV